MINLPEGDYSEAIAIIGMTGRFPGARNVQEFWQNLRNGVESIKFFTLEELSGAEIDPSLLNNPRYVGADGVVDDTDLFDAAFFNFTPREAEFMDPQHRMFLESAWEVMELAGYDSESYDGRVGVYAGAGLSSYLIRNILSHPGLYDSIGSFQIMLGNGQDFLATRVSHQMDLKGPSINVNTLCSSSFVAIHMACQSLLNYQCDLALAGGVSLQVSRNEAFFYQEGGIGDPDGHCRAFDAKASGTVSGSGLGIIVLRRLEDALADGDNILAIIRGSAVNNDGAKKISYTAPSVEGQAEVIAEAQAMAGVEPDTITLIEAHGTGTRLGDPIEVAALTKVFRASTDKQGYCALGSVKTNIGHLVTAGGIASLIKSVLALQHKQIPPSLNFEEPNPKIDFANSPFYVVTELTDWQTDGFPRRAGVSSFGIGGTNVHLVVEEMPEREASGESRPWQLLLLSAKTETALEKATVNLVEHLKQQPELNLADVAFTLQVGRRAFGYRRLVLCRDVPEAVEALSDPGSRQVWTQFQESKNRPVAFLFPGEGELQVNAGLALYEGEPAFRQAIDRCVKLLQPNLKLDLRRVLYPSAAAAEEAARQLVQPPVAQAACFVVAYALAQLWLEWGVQPQALFGDGVGEYVAACLAEVFSLEDALSLSVARGQVAMGTLSPEAFAAQVARIELEPPQIACLSSISGNWFTEAEATQPDYWVEQARQPGRGSESLARLLAEPEQVLLGVGLGETLYRRALAHPDKAAHQVVLASLPQPAGDEADVAALLTTLGQLWLAGVRVDWYGFQTHEQRHRLPLPPYPFERQRYWLEPYKPTEAGATPAARRLGQPVLSKKTDVADWFYLPSWRRTLLPIPPTEEPAQEHWLLFLDESELGAQLAQRLAQAGQQAITVQTGSEFAQVGERAFTLQPGRREDYAALLKALDSQQIRPQRVVHLWSLTPDGQTGALEQTLERGFYSLLYLAQALGKQGFTGELHLAVVSNQLQQVTAGDALCPEKAALLGPVKVIPQEYPNVTCRSLDVTWPPAAPQAQEKLADSLWAELNWGETDMVVAYRGTQRWVQTFEPVRLTEAVKAASPLRAGGVYLVVGGLDGLGWVLAEHLARTVQARLVLVADAEVPGSEKVQALEALGAQAIVVRAKVADEPQMRAVVAQAEAHFGPLDGAIYAASGFGRAAFRAIEETDRRECQEQLQPVARGLQVLAQVLADKTLDFCLLTSSLSSVLGGLGLVSYASVNNLIDAFAQRQNQTTPTPWISVNWDSWKFEAVVEAKTPFGSSLDELSIAPAEGVEVLERLLSCGDAGQWVISTGDLPTRIEQWVKMAAVRERRQARTQDAVSFYARPNLLTPYVAPRSEVEQTLVGIWRSLIGIDQIGVNDDFFELGGDSLIATQIISRVRETFEIDLPLTNLFEQPTVAFLAQYIETIRWATQESPLSATEGREEIEL